MTEFANIPAKFRPPLINIPAILLDVRAQGMSVEDALTPDTLSARQFSDIIPTNNGLTPMIRLLATDGACWASVVGVSDVGGLIIEADAMPGSASAPKRGRPPKVAEAA